MPRHTLSVRQRRRNIKAHAQHLQSLVAVQLRLWSSMSCHVRPGPPPRSPAMRRRHHCASRARSPLHTTLLVRSAPRPCWCSPHPPLQRRSHPARAIKAASAQHFLMLCNGIARRRRKQGEAVDCSYFVVAGYCSRENGLYAMRFGYLLIFRTYLAEVRVLLYTSRREVSRTFGYLPYLLQCASMTNIPPCLQCVRIPSLFRTSSCQFFRRQKFQVTTATYPPSPASPRTATSPPALISCITHMTSSVCTF